MFDPTKHEFSYMLSKDDCFRKLTGNCSLELSGDKLKYYSNIEKSLEADDEYYDFKESSVHYCRLLFKSIKQKGMHSSVDLNPHSCGHYSFSGGQHRTCIAKTSGVNRIPANIHEAWECECRVCYFKKRNPIFRVKHWLGKTDEFVR